MARVTIKMVAHGISKEQCEGCGTRFQRGEQMSGVEYEGGDPAGWFCAACLTEWRKTDKQPEPAGSGGE